MNIAVQETLIWAAVVLIPVLIILRFLARPVRHALDTWTAQHTVSEAERDAELQAGLTNIAERHDELDLRRATLAERTAAERARLAAETAQYETDLKAAEATVGAAAEARKQVLAARAEAECALAPELAATGARRSDGEMQALQEAYSTYCRRVTFPATFGAWIQGYRDE